MPWRKFDPKKDELRSDALIRLAGREARIIKVDEDSTLEKHIVIWSDDHFFQGFNLYLFPLLEIEDKPSNIRVNKETAKHLKHWYDEYYGKWGRYPTVATFWGEVDSITTDEV